VKLTRNLLIFGAVDAAISVTFFFALNTAIADES